MNVFRRTFSATFMIAFSVVIFEYHITIGTCDRLWRASDSRLRDFGDFGDNIVRDFGDFVDSIIRDFGDFGDSIVRDFGDFGDSIVRGFGDIFTIRNYMGIPIAFKTRIELNMFGYFFVIYKVVVRVNRLKRKAKRSNHFTFLNSK